MANMLFIARLYGSRRLNDQWPIRLGAVLHRIIKQGPFPRRRIKRLSPPKLASGLIRS
jgi:hypothetical protein